VPLGYDLQGRKLIPNTKEAVTVQKIFHLSLELGRVSKLLEALDRMKIGRKVCTARDGSRHGGARFYRGALYALLRNQTYIGEVRHRDQSYPGEHQGIDLRIVKVSKELFHFSRLGQASTRLPPTRAQVPGERREQTS
jgi:site-specific DNA recombinase